jgi:hypothetical protein
MGSMCARVTSGSLAVLLALGLLAPAAAPGDEPLGFLRISGDERGLLLGDVVSYPVEEYSERELAVGLAIFLPAAFDQLALYLETGQLVARDATVTSYGVMSDRAGPDALAGARFSGGEGNEAESLLDATAGSRFNLSRAEIDAFRTLRSALDGRPRAEIVEAVSREYRELLRERWEAYRRGGLAAIAPYARSGGALTDPASELRLAAADADRLRGVGAELHQALLAYPAAQPARSVDRCYWVKRQIQRRPTLSLLHQMVVSEPALVVHVERYFYVGHSYNAAQILTGALPYQDGTLVFATSRFSTDEVLGIGSQLKRAVGRLQLRDEMRKRLEALRAAVPVARPIQSP